MTSQRPLAGRRILVTRARHQAGQLSAELNALGAEVIEIPAIEILPPASFEPLDTALRNLRQYQWLIVTSANTVRSINDRLTALDLQPNAFSHLKIAAIGSATAHALQEVGVSVNLMPKEYVAESLVAAIGDQVRDARVLIARAAIARDIIPAALTQAGAQVDVVEAYRIVIPETSIARIAAIFVPGKLPPLPRDQFIHGDKFLDLLRAAGIDQPPQNLCAISIGPITSQTLRDHNWKPAAEASPHDIPGLIAATIRALIPNA